MPDLLYNPDANITMPQGTERDTTSLFFPSFTGFEIRSVEPGTKIINPSDPTEFEIVDEDHAVMSGRTFFATAAHVEALKKRGVEG